MELPRKIVWILVAIFAGVALTQVDFSTENPKEDKEAKVSREKVVEKAYKTDHLNTFVTALKTANIDEALNKNKSITVFAPSDSAFSSLPEGKYAEMMEEGHRDQLTKILNYHIVAQKVTADELKDGKVFETIQGDKIKISTGKDDEQLRVNGTKIIKTNIQASNGIIHVIDKVMMPDNHRSKSHASLR